MSDSDPVSSPGSLLADTMYPPTDPAPAAAAPTDPQPDPTADPDPIPKRGGDPAPDPDPAADPDPAPGDDPGADPIAAVGDDDDDEGEEIRTIEELAEQFNIDPEWLPNLTIKQKVNGKEIEVTLADALQTHRQVESGEQKLADAKSKAKTIVAETAVGQQLVSQQTAALGTILKRAEDILQGEDAGINWEELRRLDPAEFAAKKQEITDRQGAINQLKQEAANTLVLADQESQALIAQRMPEEQALFLERIPEWSDEDKKAKERPEVIAYLTQEGFSELDIQAASHNGRILSLVVKAKRYDDITAKANAAKKKVRKVPKITKPGAKVSSRKPTANSQDPVSILYGSG